MRSCASKRSATPSWAQASCAACWSTAGLLILAAAAGLILAQRDYKRLLAYSSIEHMGMLALAAAIGGALAIAAVLLHMLGHGLVKAVMFVVAGRILAERGQHADRRCARPAGAPTRPGHTVPGRHGRPARVSPVRAVLHRGRHRGRWLAGWAGGRWLSCCACCSWCSPGWPGTCGDDARPGRRPGAGRVSPGGCDRPLPGSPHGPGAWPSRGDRGGRVRCRPLAGGARRRPGALGGRHDRIAATTGSSSGTCAPTTCRAAAGLLDDGSAAGPGRWPRGR